MNLETLASRLESARSSTDVAQVIFDYFDYLNTDRDKTYPLVMWDFGNTKVVKNLRAGSATPGVTGKYEINVYCIVLTEPEDDIKLGRLQKWDAAEVDLLAYLNAVNTISNGDVDIPDLNEVEVEYYTSGLLSVDREVGVRYRVTLQTWC